MTALVPRLTCLDERVLEALPCDPERPGVRATAIAASLQATMPAHVDVRPGTVREILRGLEHVGLCLQAGGWWHRGVA